MARAEQSRGIGARYDWFGGCLLGIGRVGVRELLVMLLLQSFVGVVIAIVGGVSRQGMKVLLVIVDHASSLVRWQRYHLSGKAVASVWVGLLEEWQLVIFVEGGDESVGGVPAVMNEQMDRRVE